MIPRPDQEPRVFSGPMRSFLAAGLPLVLASLLPGCGSDGGTSPNRPPPVNTTSDPEVLRACTSFAERLCAGSAECCMSTEGRFSQEFCVDELVADLCTTAAQLVASGRAEYDVSAEDACLAAHQRSHDMCVPDWDELGVIRRDVWSVCRVIKGSVRPGGACTTSSMCASPEGEATSDCIQGVCQEVRYLAEGDLCPFPNGNVPVCGTGLYCTAVERDEIGRCEPATAEGAACSAVKLNPECGLGRYCDLADGVCRTAVNFGGPTCQQDTECVSFICDELIDTCEEPRSTVYGLCGEAL